MTGSPAFVRTAISPTGYLGESWGRVKGQYWLFVGITAAGLIIGSLVPLGLLMGAMMCGIHLCYRQQAKGLPVSFDLLFKGFDHFGEAFIATLLMVLASLAVVLPMMALMFAGLFMGALGGAAGEGARAGMAFGSCLLFGIAILVVVAGSALIGVFFTFTYPLILDRGVSGVEAVKLSFQAARANLGGLLLLTLLNVLLGFAGALCCYIGAFLILPITFGTHWICYEQVFGMKADEIPPAI